MAKLSKVGFMKRSRETGKVWDAFVQKWRTAAEMEAEAQGETVDEAEDGGWQPLKERISETLQRRAPAPLN